LLSDTIHLSIVFNNKRVIHGICSVAPLPIVTFIFYKLLKVTPLPD
jgi:hypothetical protein